MNNPPIITRLKVKHDTSGLIFSRGFWKVQYFADGVQRYVSLRTSKKAEATRRRDKFYAKLDAEGAQIKPRKQREPVTLNTLEDPDNNNRYICHRKPYLVKVQGVSVGSFDTIEEARAARNAYLDID